MNNIRDFFHSLPWKKVVDKVRETFSNPSVYLPVIAAAALAAPFISSVNYYRHLLIISLVYLVLSTSLNLIMGYTGQLALGHAAFYGIGAYTFTLLVMKTSTPYWISFIAGGILSALAAAFLGVIVLRLRGHYLAILTLAFGEIVRIVLYNWVGLTRGPMGLTDIPEPRIFSYQFKGLLSYYYLMLFIAVVSYLVFWRLIKSRQGRAFIAIREEETAAKAMGVNTTWMKILSFVVGCFFAGIAGSFIATYIKYIHPDNFTAWGSLILNAMVVIGGEGSMVGAAIGAVLLTAVPEILRFGQQYRMVIYAIALMGSIILWPYGIVGRPKPPQEDEEEDEASWQAIGRDLRNAEKIPEEEGGKQDLDGSIVLQARGVRKEFGGLIAVNDVDLDVTKKQIHSIIGPNGAGKTTFFNVLSGFYQPEGGSIKYKSNELIGLQPNEICDLGVSRTFQRIRLFRMMTVMENVLVGSNTRMSATPIDSIFRTKRMVTEEKYIRQRALQLLDFVGLKDKQNQFANNLPYGEQRRLEIARALATDVNLLLLDEPTAGMSPEETQDVIYLISELMENLDITIILIEHDMKVVMGISDVISVLDHGKKIAEGSPEEIRTNELVIEAYLGKEYLEVQ
jgi:branched-chain amino acid transport system permease protein